MTHRNIGFLEARKTVEKLSRPWRSNPAFSSGAESPRGHIKINMRKFAPLKTPGRRREGDNIETSESNEAPNQPIGWNPGRRQWKMTTNNSRTQISEPTPSDVEKRNNSKDQAVLEKSLDELEPIQTKDEVKNVLVMIINLVINSGDVEAMIRHLWKAIELQEQHYNEIKRESTN
jgi:U3 small nucleolar RNA-associated protein 14